MNNNPYKVYSHRKLLLRIKTFAKRYMKNFDNKIIMFICNNWKNDIKPLSAETSFFSNYIKKLLFLLILNLEIEHLSNWYKIIRIEIVKYQEISKKDIWKWQQLLITRLTIEIFLFHIFSFFASSVLKS